MLPHSLPVVELTKVFLEVIWLASESPQLG